MGTLTDFGNVYRVDEFADTPLPIPSESSGLYRAGYEEQAENFEEASDMSVSETDEGRLSRALRSWLPEYVIVPLMPKEKPPVEPVFSAKLGKEPTLKHAYSSESLATDLSLLTCSTLGERTVSSRASTRRGRLRRRAVSRSTTISEETQKPPSKWVELASRRQARIFDKWAKSHTAAITDYYIGGYNETESEAFALMEEDERIGLFRTAKRTGIRYTTDMKKSNSMTNIKSETSPQSRRIVSASVTRSRGKPLDLNELKKQMLLHKQKTEQKTSKMKAMGNRKLVHKESILSMVSDSLEMDSDSSSEFRPFSPSEHSSPETPPNERVSVWKGDKEILEIDLKRDLTSRVKKKIQSTASALERVTGLGEPNRPRSVIGRHDEFPMHVEEDFCIKPRITQKIRISPELSFVIKDDIKVRMGRPRYHEIRIRDLEQWNKGQDMGRSHRNLKVFNWLHSLKEAEFQKEVIPVIKDAVPEVSNNIDLFHIESADEPDVKPLYKSYEVRIL
ncbi:hypothetical protein ACJMK2_006486 [Sinanodonta woodiana]|uniref:Uncharacterized protein n=1 Tax=Sinanodonta woodiana TaxID=1069815 RepID=A0ABD3VUM5_SINWO